MVLKDDETSEKLRDTRRISKQGKNFSWYQTAWKLNYAGMFRALIFQKILTRFSTSKSILFSLIRLVSKPTKKATYTQNLLVIKFNFSRFRKHNKNKTIIYLTELSPVAIYAIINISCLSFINVNIMF